MLQHRWIKLARITEARMMEFSSSHAAYSEQFDKNNGTGENDEKYSTGVCLGLRPVRNHCTLSYAAFRWRFRCISRGIQRH